MSANCLLLLPVLVPLGLGVLSLPARTPWQRRLGIAGVTAHVVATVALVALVYSRGVIAVQLADWPAPFGITFVSDLFSGLLLVSMSVISWFVFIHSTTSVPKDTQELAFYPVALFLLAGVSGALLTGDLFNLYVWYEVLLMASFVLLTLGARRAQLEGGLKYVALNLLASTLFLVGVGLLYGSVGTLNLADLSVRMAATPLALPPLAGVFLLFVSFGIKSAVFPLYGWLPASYPTPPAAVGALFSALLTKVGVYSMIRVGTLLLPEPPSLVSHGLLSVAALTMLTGVLGAVAQTELKRLLSFHIVSQIGYLVFGFALSSAAGLAGTIYFFLHVSVAKAALFLVAGELERLYGTTELSRLGDGYRRHPVLAAACFIAAMGLAGLPPLSGAFAKLQLVIAGLQQGALVTVAVALLVSVLTLFSMTKIWAEAFWKDCPTLRRQPATHLTAMRGATASLAALTLLLGMFAEPLLGLSQKAAEQLLERRQYVNAVLGGS